MNNYESPQHQVIHDAMQYPAEVAIPLINKPEVPQHFDVSEVEHVFEAMRLDNVNRNLGSKVVDLQGMVDNDALTAAESRVRGEERIQELIDGAKGLELYFLDFNNFKEVNDTLGHKTGDTTLITLVASLIGSLREGETIHRFGGDEFVIVKDTSIPSDRREMQKPVVDDNREIKGKNRRDTDADNSVEGLKVRFSLAFNEGLETMEQILGKEICHRMGLSIGHAVYKNGQSLNELLTEADISMYTDKISQRKHKISTEV